MPRAVFIESEYGAVDLDLSRAVIDSRTVDIELRLQYGRAKITLPEDVTVDLDALQAVWRQPRYRPPRTTLPGARKIRISGSMEYGRLTVRHKRRRPR